MDKRDLGRLMACPWPVLISAQIVILAAIIALGWLTLLRHEWDAVVRLRMDVVQCERRVLELRRWRTAAPAAARLDRDIQRMSRQLAWYETMRRDPGAVIGILRPGSNGTFGWKEHEHNGESATARDWTIAVTTDYPSLEAMMRDLATQSGGRALRALRIARRDRFLQVEFTLAQTIGSGARYD